MLNNAIKDLQKRLKSKRQTKAKEKKMFDNDILNRLQASVIIIDLYVGL
jgi:hypothetical protein